MKTRQSRRQTAKVCAFPLARLRDRRSYNGAESAVIPQKLPFTIRALWK